MGRVADRRGHCVVFGRCAPQGYWVRIYCRFVQILETSQSDTVDLLELDVSAQADREANYLMSPSRGRWADNEAWAVRQ